MTGETTTATFPQPLAGRTVVDLSNLFPGPYCTAQLAAFGARVVKVEPPPHGDPMREFTPRMFDELNRNKESVAIDLKRAEGKALLKRLVAGADALVEGFRPGVMDRLGLGYRTLAELNPALVYCAISGFGQDGPYRDRPGHDLGFLAMGGYYSVPSQIRDVKSRPNVRLADAAAGQMAAYATSMAMWEAAATGRGRLVDTSIFDCVAAMAVPMIASYAGAGDVRQMDHVMADSDLYETLDGRYLALTTFEDKYWRRFATAVEKQSPGLADARFATRAGRNGHKIELRADLEKLFKTATLAQWQQLLDGADTTYGAVRERKELLADPHFAARGLTGAVEGSCDRRAYALFPVKFSGTRETIRRAAPAVGADTDSVLHALGCSAADIGELRRQSVVQ